MPERRGARSGHVTPREVEVLNLLAEGFGNAEIAVTLELAVRTVKSHIDNCASKLGVRGEKTGHRILLARFWECELFRIGAGKTSWMRPQEMPYPAWVQFGAALPPGTPAGRSVPDGSPPQAKTPPGRMTCRSCSKRCADGQPCACP